MIHPIGTETLAAAAGVSSFDADAERGARARALIARIAETYPGRTALSVSFGGASGMVLLDLALTVVPDLRVFVLDTELLFPETYALVQRVEHRYGITVDAVRPRESVAEQNARLGDALWARNPDACCNLRKVEPLRAYLADVDAWLTGVRRDQSATRAEVPLVAWNEAAQVVKVAPLAEWTSADVDRYVAKHELPMNTLLYEGYRSLGCVHCTARVQVGEPERAGRWRGFAKTECGIHVA